MRATLAFSCQVSTALRERALDVLEGEVDERGRAAGDGGGGARVPVVGGHGAAERHVHVRVPVDEARHQPGAGDVDDLRAVAREVDADRGDRPAVEGDVGGGTRTRRSRPCRRRGWSSCGGYLRCALGEDRAEHVDDVVEVGVGQRERRGERDDVVEARRGVDVAAEQEPAASGPRRRGRRRSMRSTGLRVALSATSSMPTSRPRPRMSPTSGWSPIASRSRCCSSAPLTAERSSSRSSSMIAIVSSATAQPAGWPAERVDVAQAAACRPGRRGRRRRCPGRRPWPRAGCRRR